ncbi:hypothetical protein NHQ30_007731 [Ciborinia camelliae]|nr:hypothetical protein NHQ30_007731 [Ciborinia camelliae]
MSPSSPTSNSFCGLGHRTSNTHSRSHSRSHSHPNNNASDANSITSSLHRYHKIAALNARPLHPRPRESNTSTTTTTTRIVISNKPKKGDHPDKSSNHQYSTSENPTSSAPRHLKLKKSSQSPNFSLPLNNNNPKRPPAEFQWAREDQLSVILEYLDETRSTTHSEAADPSNPAPGQAQAQAQVPPRAPTPPLAIPETIRENLSPTPTLTGATSPSPRTPKFHKIGVRERASHSRIPSYNRDPTHPNRANSTNSTSEKRRNLERRFEERNLGFPDIDDTEDQVFASSALGIRMSSSVGVSEKGTPEGFPRGIAHPPKDLESIARIDSSLIFEHFTTTDAWVLGSALRERLLPHPTPVVISISLSNANQVLFHCCTHSGTMPDNDSWVSRKRKTVLRWGVSTWYMWCKFEGDESAFARKYGLGNEAGEYAIHGGGVPIRVTGVEGVVACVVVSGLKQWEDHGVIVEVIRDLYY